MVKRGMRISHRKGPQTTKHEIKIRTRFSRVPISGHKEWSGSRKNKEDKDHKPKANTREPANEFMYPASIGIAQTNGGSVPGIMVATLVVDRRPTEYEGDEYRFIVFSTSEEVTRYSRPNIRADAIVDLIESFHLRNLSQSVVYLGTKFSRAEQQVHAAYIGRGLETPARILVLNGESRDYPLVIRASNLAKDLCGVYRSGSNSGSKQYELNRIFLN